MALAKPIPLKHIAILILATLFSCKEVRKEVLLIENSSSQSAVSYAKGFTFEQTKSDIKIIKITSPWPDAEAEFRYALIPKDLMARINLPLGAYDAIIAVPVERLVVTSTTHIPALEALGVLDKLVGFPDTEYISSQGARQRIDAGQIKELGNNESINTEMVMELNPDVVVGFGIDNQNKAYGTLQRSDMPVVYNGDWTEQTPLGKAEWIKFFAPFFGLEKKADSIFARIESSYKAAKKLAKEAKTKPSVLSGALYKDVWYLPGGNSWASQFLSDANTNYLWKETEDAGSLSLSLEAVLSKGQKADFWVSPSQFTSYQAMEQANQHYLQFDAFKNKNVYTFSKTNGETGGLLYYELAPQRPDLVLKDLIHIFHPELLPEHQLFFFKPLD